MAIKDKLIKLANEKNNPSVTISLNTHRTHPDSLKDEILLKNLLFEAEKRIIEEYGKRQVASLLEKIKNVGTEINRDYNLDSLHLFLSNDTKEFIKITWPTHEDKVQIGETFDLRSIIKAYNRVKEYYILELSQGGVHLYEAMNDAIIKEIKNEYFPFGPNPNHPIDNERKSEAKLMDDLVKEYFNDVDKAVVNAYNELDLDCVVICTEDNYSRLLEVADRPEIYIGHIPIDYNNTAKHQLAAQGWNFIKEKMHKERGLAIAEMKEAVGAGIVLTDIAEIYQAAVDGRGDTLIVYEEFSQPAKIIDERTIEIVENTIADGVVEDITSDIAWEVMSKKGRVIFTLQDEIKELGEIVLKTRY